MSDANAKSSRTSKKEVEEKQNNVKIVGGPVSIACKNNEYSIEMNPEYALDFSVEMTDLVKSVGSYTKIVDKEGNIVKRVDNKTGAEYVLNKKSIKKVINKSER